MTESNFEYIYIKMDMVINYEQLSKHIMRQLDCGKQRIFLVLLPNSSR